MVGFVVCDDFWTLLLGLNFVIDFFIFGEQILIDLSGCLWILYWHRDRRGRDFNRRIDLDLLNFGLWL